jgi:hypothetical protein
MHEGNKGGSEMTGFDSKRSAALAKLKKSEDLLEESVKALKASQAKLDEDNMLTIVYQRGFADGKQAAQRKPLTDEQIKAALTVAVQSGAVSWLGFEKDEDNRYTIPSLSPQHYQIARAIEAAHGIKEQP